MDVNFNKYSNVSFLTFVCTVFISSKNHIQVLNRSSKAGAALVKTITSYTIRGQLVSVLGTFRYSKCHNSANISDIGAFSSGGRGGRQNARRLV